MERDAALAIVREIWTDLTDRRGFSMDGIDDETQAQIVAKWYTIAARKINPGTDQIPPADILRRVRGW